MGRNIPVNLNDVPDSTLLPVGMYLMTVDTIEETTTNPDKGIARLMYKTVFKVVEPTQFAGVPLFEYFVIGNNDDPDAKDASTWMNSIGAKRLKRLAKSTMVPVTNDADGMIGAITGQRFVASIGQKIDDGVRDPKYAGTRRNTIESMYAVGTQAVGITGSSDLALDEAPAIPATLKTSAAEQTAVAPTAAPAKPATKAAASPTVPCPYCGTTVTRADYMTHIRATHPENE